jgi:hypothetical protein
MSPSTAHLAEKLEILSPQEMATVEDFVEFLLTRGYERVLAHSAAAVSAPAFQAIWNNSEDDAYDAL